eukprot:g19400.t1
MTFAVSSNISSQCLSDSEPDVGPSSSKSSRKRSNPGAALHGDFIRAKTAQESSMEFDTHDKLRRPETRIAGLTESSLCEYNVLVQTTLLCGHHRLVPRLPRGKEMIHCVAQEEKVEDSEL